VERCLAGEAVVNRDTSSRGTLTLPVLYRFSDQGRKTSHGKILGAANRHDTESRQKERAFSLHRPAHHGLASEAPLHGRNLSNPGEVKPLITNHQSPIRRARCLLRAGQSPFTSHLSLLLRRYLLRSGLGAEFVGEE
jgi:hypothetical protein